MVATVRRALGDRRVGHCGTLDPFASGLLVLCVGKATRLAEYLMGTAKSYLATARLGVETESHDPEGRRTKSSEGWTELDREDVNMALTEFTGEIEQVPPRFSAKKVAGVRAYQSARRGKEVVLAPRKVTIHRLEIVRWIPPVVVLRVDCSAGTYVRALARDLGRQLRVGAHLTALRRTRSGSVSVTDAVTPEALEDGDAVARTRLSPLRALSHLPRVCVDAADIIELRFGRSIVNVSARSLVPGPVIISHRGELAAIATLERTSTGSALLKPRKVFVAG